MRGKYLIVYPMLLALLVCSFSALPISAENAQGIPYSSYQEWNGQSNTGYVLQQNVYEPCAYLDGGQMGIGMLDQPQDLFVSQDAIYLLDSGNSRVVVLNTDYSFNRVIERWSYQGEMLQITGAKGIYVNRDGFLYIADTENGRVLKADREGRVLTIYGRPESEIIPENLEFRPSKITEDDNGFLFILCEGMYYGAMVLDADGRFCNFYGANLSKGTLVSTVQKVLESFFMTEKKQQWTARTLPYEFSDITCVDGFIYTVTATSTDGQIRKLSYAGSSVLTREGNTADYFDFGTVSDFAMQDGTYIRDQFIAMAVDAQHTMYALESTYGRVLVYDSECRLITAFGGGFSSGTVTGTFVSACEIAVNGTEVLVLDRDLATVTVFRRTAYGKLLFEAIGYSNQGNYTAAFPLWQQVRSVDCYNQLAIIGIANYYLANDEYAQALSYARQGADRKIYERAFEELRRNVLQANLVWIFLGLAVGSLLLFVFSQVRRKHPAWRINNVCYSFVTTAWKHPVRCFTVMKEKQLVKGKNGKALFLVSLGLMLLFFVFNVLEMTAGGFMYTDYDPQTYNSMLVFLSTVGVAVLWCICNWGACTLFEGKGTFKEIVVVTGIALIPRILYSIFYIVGSQVLVYSEEAILTITSSVSWLATCIILLIGMSIVHDYSFFRAIAMSIVTVLGMFIVAFFILLLLTLYQDLLNFVLGLGTELFYHYSG